MLSSPWTDLVPSTPRNFFSINGDRPSYIRSFMMNSGYNGCENDNGWMMMAEKVSGCDWDKGLTENAMVYSLLSTRATYHTSGKKFLI